MRWLDMSTLDDLQQHQDAFYSLLRERAVGWLDDGDGIEVDAALERHARRWLEVLRTVLPTIDDGNARNLRLAAIPPLLDLAAAASVRDPIAAEGWRDAAQSLGAATKYVEPIASARGFPLWFREAQRLHWMQMTGRPDAELDAAEARFLAQYTDPVIRRYGLG